MMKKNVCVLALALMLVPGLVFATGKKDQKAAAGSITEDDLSKHRTITAWLYADDYKYYSSYDDNPVVRFLNEKFNATLKFQQPPMGSEVDQFNLMIGTGDYTDVMVLTYSQDSAKVLYEDGVIRDLAPYVEKFMPNYYKRLHDPANKDIYRALYDEEGHIFSLSYDMCDELEIMWGGLVYRRDILETMTGGNVHFPSGNAEPTTIEDWEYMLPLMTMYFQAAGMKDYAGLILPYNGFVATGEFLNGFGTSGTFMVDGNKVTFGPTSPEFYNYLVKMREWYSKGWIYQDFASRTNDLFYLPNPALTYGASAGVWFGLVSQCGDQMSMPEYGLFTDVHAISSPLDTAHGQNGSKSGSLVLMMERATNGWAVSTSCSEENLVRFCTMMDYLYSDEGAVMKTLGLSVEQAQNDPVYKAQGVKNGWEKTADGYYVKAYRFTPAAGADQLDVASFIGMRLPGYCLHAGTNRQAPEIDKVCHAAWTKYGNKNNFPGSVTFTVDEAKANASAYTRYNDYINEMVPKFIMGTEPLNEKSYAAYVDRCNSLGVKESLERCQAAYNRYLSN